MPIIIYIVSKFAPVKEHRNKKLYTHFSLLGLLQKYSMMRLGLPETIDFIILPHGKSWHFYLPYNERKPFSPPPNGERVAALFQALQHFRDPRTLRVRRREGKR